MPCSSVSAFTLGEILVVSSTSRPTGVDLYAGRYIYEADTGRTMLYDGTGWIVMDEPAQSWSNPIVGVTGGSPTFSGSYHRSGGWLEFDGRYTLGGAPSAFAPQITLPVAAAQTRFNQFAVAFTDNGVTNYVGIADRGTTTIALSISTSSGTYTSVTVPSTTVPFTWGAADFVEFAGRYLMASRYS